MKMYVWRTGLINIGPRTPDGAIEVGNGSQEQLEEWLVYARLTKDGKQHLVTGIPEAETSDEAMDALFTFQKIIYNKMHHRPAFQDIERETA